MKLRKGLIQLPYKIKPVATLVAFQHCCKAIITLWQLDTRPIHIIKLNIEYRNTSTYSPALVHVYLCTPLCRCSCLCSVTGLHSLCSTSLSLILPWDSSQGKYCILKYSIYTARNKHTEANSYLYSCLQNSHPIFTFEIHPTFPSVALSAPGT